MVRSKADICFIKAAITYTYDTATIRTNCNAYALTTKHNKSSAPLPSLRCRVSVNIAWQAREYFFLLRIRATRQLNFIYTCGQTAMH